MPGSDLRYGSIPACAGEPFTAFPGFQTIMVYPRVCGGTCFGNCADLHKAGLSPRVRGNRNPSLRLLIPSGSIPACAGEPQS